MSESAHLKKFSSARSKWARPSSSGLICPRRISASGAEAGSLLLSARTVAGRCSISGMRRATWVTFARTGKCMYDSQECYELAKRALEALDRIEQPMLEGIRQQEGDDG